jgi:hypothetical protein
VQLTALYLHVRLQPLYHSTRTSKRDCPLVQESSLSAMLLRVHRWEFSRKTGASKGLQSHSCTSASKRSLATRACCMQVHDRSKDRSRRGPICEVLCIQEAHQGRWLFNRLSLALLV